MCVCVHACMHTCMCVFPSLSLSHMSLSGRCCFCAAKVLYVCWLVGLLDYRFLICLVLKVFFVVVCVVLLGKSRGGGMLAYW